MDEQGRCLRDPGGSDPLAHGVTGRAFDGGGHVSWASVYGPGDVAQRDGLERSALNVLEGIGDQVVR